MKRFLFTIFLLGVLSPLAAQLYHPGEQLFYRVSYKAKMFPNTEFQPLQGRRLGRTLPPLVLQPGGCLHRVDRHPSLRPVRFESDIREGDYTFQRTSGPARPSTPAGGAAKTPSARSRWP